MHTLRVVTNHIHVHVESYNRKKGVKIGCLLILTYKFFSASHSVQEETLLTPPIPSSWYWTIIQCHIYLSMPIAMYISSRTILSSCRSTWWLQMSSLKWQSTIIIQEGEPVDITDRLLLVSDAPRNSLRGWNFKNFLGEHTIVLALFDSAIVVFALPHDKNLKWNPD